MSNKNSKLNSRRQAIECEYEYQNNLKNNEGTLLAEMKTNISAILLALVCGLVLYFKFDDLHLILKIILGIFVAGGSITFFAVIFSKALWIYAFHYIITFCLDLIFFIILLPRKLFGKKKPFEENEDDKAKMYSDIT